MSNFSDVGDFHRKFDLHASDDGPWPTEVSPELYAFRRAFMQEELDEFVAGWNENDHAKIADSLIDIVYVAMGTAHLFGYPWQDLWDEVQRANMQKERATVGKVGPRGNATFDVIKPPGWTQPDIAGVLDKHGWPAMGVDEG